MRKSSLVCKCKLGGVMDSKWLVNGFVDKMMTIDIIKVLYLAIARTLTTRYNISLAPIQKNGNR